jgi:hypothetical protein
LHASPLTFLLSKSATVLKSSVQRETTLHIAYFPLNDRMSRYLPFNEDDFWFCEAVNRAPCTLLYRLLFDNEYPFRLVALFALSFFLIGTNYLHGTCHMILSPMSPFPREDNEDGNKDMYIRMKMATGRRFDFLPFKDVQQDKRSFGCCPICLHNFEIEEEVVRSTSCKHVFHQDCLVLWFHRGSSCPCCREVLLSP